MSKRTFGLYRPDRFPFPVVFPVVRNPRRGGHARVNDKCIESVKEGGDINEDQGRGSLLPRSQVCS